MHSIERWDTKSWPSLIFQFGLLLDVKLSKPASISFSTKHSAPPGLVDLALSLAFPRPLDPTGVGHWLVGLGCLRRRRRLAVICKINYLFHVLPSPHIAVLLPLSFYSFVSPSPDSLLLSPRSSVGHAALPSSVNFLFVFCSSASPGPAFATRVPLLS
jgi:hypothetical protein